VTFSLTHLLSVAMGGALGASLRYLFLCFVQGGAWGVFGLNMIGSLLLGMLLAAAGERAPGLTAFAGTGLLGALTTYSAFSGDIVRLAGQNMASAAIYVGASLLFGVLAFLLGSLIGRAL
jgi:CrcB protein